MAVLLSLKEVKQAKPLCFPTSLANASKREKGKENCRISESDNAYVESSLLLIKHDFEMSHFGTFQEVKKTM